MLLTILFFCWGMFFTSLLYALNPTLSFWWRLPIFLGFYIAVALVYILVVVFGLYFFLPKGDPSPKRRHSPMV